jgi:putative MATE family efflux protein
MGCVEHHGRARMDSDRSEQLGQGSVVGLLLRFSAPAIVGAVAQALYQIIDTVFVGQAIGNDGIAGTTVALPTMIGVVAFGMLVGIGAAALISIRLGERRKNEAEAILGSALFLLIVASVVITTFGLYFLDDILVACHASKVVLPLARSYLRIILIGTIFQNILFGLNAAIRGEGNPRIAMLSMLISVLLNLILAPIFIFWFHGGMAGAALATVIAQGVSAIWVVAYFFSGSSVLKFHAKNLWPNWGRCLAIMKVGSPAFAMMLANAVLQIAFAWQLGKYGGDTAISVWGIIYRVLMLVFMPIVGLNQGAQPIIGYNYGARQFDRVKRTLETAILAATAVTTCGFVVSMLFPTQLVHLFAEDAHDLIPLGPHAMRICTIMLPIVGFQVVSTSYFQAVGKSRQAMILMLSRQVILLIPAVMILPYFFGLDGVWASLPTADFCSFAWTGICLIVELRHLRDQHEATIA